MKDFFQEKVVLLVGATGGLGNAAAQAFAAQDARLLLAGRNPAKLEMLREQFSAPIFPVDMTDVSSITSMKEQVHSISPQVDVVVNLSGMDVRRRIEDHSVEEIQQLLLLNLAGSIHLTKMFLPWMKAQRQGVILHVGGFADGRLAFPFYSVDAATRAGLAKFIEALNRELRVEKSPVRLIYFSPSPADTDAERPYHGIWREMGIRIESPDRVANELLRAIRQPSEHYLMGGFLTDLSSRLNAAFPRLADAFIMDRYSKILQKHLGG